MRKLLPELRIWIQSILKCSSMAITAGATARRKTLLVRGDGKALVARLNQWMEGHHG